MILHNFLVCLIKLPHYGQCQIICKRNVLSIRYIELLVIMLLLQYLHDWDSTTTAVVINSTFCWKEPTLQSTINSCCVFVTSWFRQSNWLCRQLEQWKKSPDWTWTTTSVRLVESWSDILTLISSSMWKCCKKQKLIAVTRAWDWN